MIRNITSLKSIDVVPAIQIFMYSIQENTCNFHFTTVNPQFYVFITHSSYTQKQREKKNNENVSKNLEMSICHFLFLLCNLFDSVATITYSQSQNTIAALLLYTLNCQTNTALTITDLVSVQCYYHVPCQTAMMIMLLNLVRSSVFPVMEMLVSFQAAWSIC